MRPGEHDWRVPLALGDVEQPGGRAADAVVRYAETLVLRVGLRGREGAQRRNKSGGKRR